MAGISLNVIRAIFAYMVMKVLAGLVILALVGASPVFAETAPNVEVTGIENISEDLYMIHYKLCTGSYQIVQPKLKVDSDIGPRDTRVDKAVSPNSCINGVTSTYADNPDTIKVSLYNFKEEMKSKGDTERAKDKLGEMQKEIDDLKSQLKGKDEIIKAQMQVIMDLANKIKSTMGNFLDMLAAA